MMRAATEIVRAVQTLLSEGFLYCLFGGERRSSSVLLGVKAWESFIRGSSAGQGQEPGDHKPCLPF